MSRYIELEQSFLKQNEYRLGPSSQFLPVYQLLLAKIRNHPTVFNRYQYWGKLLTAEQIIDYIVSALRAYWLDAPADRIWSPIDPGLAMLHKPDYWLEVSPVDKIALQEAAARYIEEPWLQLNIIDWYILNGFIYDELLRNAALIQSEGSPSKNWNSIFPDSEFMNSASYKPHVNRVKSVILWFLIPAVVICLYYFGHGGWASLFLLPYVLYMAVSLLSLPDKLAKRRIRQESCDLHQKQNRLRQLYEMVSSSSFNPSRLKEQIADMMRDNIHLSPLITIITDKAIERDPSIFRV